MGEFEFLHVTYSITGHSVPLCLCACIRLQYGRVRVWCGVVFRFLLRHRLLSLYVTSPGGGNQTTFWRGRRSSGGRRQRFGCRLPTCLALCRAMHFRTPLMKACSFCCRSADQVSGSSSCSRPFGPALGGFPPLGTPSLL